MRLDFSMGAMACVLAWLMFAPFATLDIDPWHDGVMLKPALDVATGQTLFRDSCMVYGALTTWLQAAALSWFGQTLRVFNLATAFMYGLIAGTLVMAWRLVLPRTLALVAGVLWFLLSALNFDLHGWSSVYALFFQALALVAVMRALTLKGRGSALASGVLAGVTFLTRQFPIGVATCATVITGFATVAIVFPSHRRQCVEAVAAAGIGVLVVIVVFLLHLTLHGSLTDWWDQTIILGLRWGQNLEGTGVLDSLPSFDRWWRNGLLFCTVAAIVLRMVRDGRGSLVGLALALSTAYALVVGRLIQPSLLALGPPGVALLIVSAWTIHRAVRGRTAPTPTTMAMVAAVVMSLGAWTQAYPLGDPQHLFWALSPSIGFSLVPAWELSGRRTMLTAVLLCLLWIPAGSSKVSQLLGRLGAPRVELTEPVRLAGMRVAPQYAAAWTRLAEAMREYSRTRPRWPLLLEGNNMVAAALAPDLRNSDPFFFRYEGFVPYDDEKRAAFIERERPLVFRQAVPGPAVRTAMERIGYVPLANAFGGELLAPRGAGSPTLRTVLSTSGG